jgi:hypothetical protein
MNKGQANNLLHKFYFMLDVNFLRTDNKRFVPVIVVQELLSTGSIRQKDVRNGMIFVHEFVDEEGTTFYEYGYNGPDKWNPTCQTINAYFGMSLLHCVVAENPIGDHTYNLVFKPRAILSDDLVPYVPDTVLYWGGHDYTGEMELKAINELPRALNIYQSTLLDSKGDLLMPKI